MARFLLPYRDPPPGSPPPFASGKANATNPPPPGAPGRWRMAENLSGLHSLARMLGSIDDMNTMVVVYTFLQCAVVLGLIFRLIMYLSFQKRLSVIGGTLVRTFARRLWLSSSHPTWASAAEAFGYKRG